MSNEDLMIVIVVMIIANIALIALTIYEEKYADLSE